MSPILHNKPSASPSPWYSNAMHATPSCPPAVMTTDLFALKHRRRPLSLDMFCALYRIVLQRLLPSFLYSHVPIIKCSPNTCGSALMPSSLINCIDTTATSASTTPYLGACIAQFESPTFLFLFFFNYMLLALL